MIDNTDSLNASILKYISLMHDCLYSFFAILSVHHSTDIISILRHKHRQKLDNYAFLCLKYHIHPSLLIDEHLGVIRQGPLKQRYCISDICADDQRKSVCILTDPP